MATFEFELATPPVGERDYELWIQHAAGFILFEDVRDYALKKIDPSLAPAAVQKGIDDAIYGLMMVVDGVSGALINSTDRVFVSMTVRHWKHETSGIPTVVSELDLANGDGMSMGVHGWREGDFGTNRVAVSRKPS